MNKKYIVRLSDEQRQRLNTIIKRGKAAAHTIRHAHILLKADAHGPAWTDAAIAKALNVHVATVWGIRRRFVEHGFEAALNRKKQQYPSRRPLLDGAGEAKLIALRCGQPPEGYATWSLRLLADKAVELNITDSISHETVRQMLKKTSCARIRRRCG